MLAVLAFLVARQVGVNYFVAAFVGGIAFRAGIGEDDEEATELPELIGRVLALAVWFVFGAALVLDGLEGVDWRIVLYSVLSLTVVRMVPVAISMIGAGFGRPATLFIGWFGPRGLASVVFGLLIVEELPVDDARVGTVLSTIVLTVLLSVMAHGISGRPLHGMDATAGPGLGWRRRHCHPASVTLRPPPLLRPQKAPAGCASSRPDGHVHSSPRAATTIPVGRICGECVPPTHQNPPGYRATMRGHALSRFVQSVPLPASCRCRRGSVAHQRRSQVRSRWCAPCRWLILPIAWSALFAACPASGRSAPTSACGCAPTSSPGSCWRRSWCRRAWPTPSWPACRR